MSRIAAEDPDVVIVLPCGFDVPRSLHEIEDPEIRAGLDSIPAVREGRGWVLDGNAYFNRPGPRLVESTELLAGVLHPEAFPEVAEEYDWAIAKL